jgi:peptidyl-prolyl cis-trans isomerase B (cyclophilin B)
VEDIPVSGDDERQRQLAREHKERQAQRTTAQSAKGRRNAFIGAGVAVVVVAGGVFAATTLINKDPRQAAAADSTPSPSVSTPGLSSPVPSISALPKKAGKLTCAYTRDKTGVPQKYVGMPNANPKPYMKVKTMTVSTNHGNIVIDVDPTATPCSVNSMAFLAKKGFYDNTKCHRLATMESSGVYMLQCGDALAKADGKNPADGTGTAGYFSPDEAFGAMPLTRGVVFLTQPEGNGNMNSSQFAISMADENAQVQTPYSILGVVRSGLEIIDKVAKKGVIVNSQDIVGDGGSTAPKDPVVIKKVSLR